MSSCWREDRSSTPRVDRLLRPVDRGLLDGRSPGRGLLGRGLLDRALITCGVVGMLSLVLVSTLDGATRHDGYDPVRHWVSLLAHGERSWLGTAALIGSGAMLLAAAPGFRGAESRLGLVGGLWRAVALLGGSLLVAGVFPMDPTTSYPGDLVLVPEVSLSARVHAVAGVSIIAAIVLLLRAIGRWSTTDVRPNASHRRSPATTSTARSAANLGAAAVWLSSGACAALAAIRSGSWEAAMSGAVQRFALAVGAVALTLAGLWLARASSDGGAGSRHRATRLESSGRGRGRPG